MLRSNRPILVGRTRRHRARKPTPLRTAGHVRSGVSNGSGASNDKSPGATHLAPRSILKRDPVMSAASPLHGCQPAA